MELGIGQHAIIEFDGRSFDGITTAGMVTQAKQVGFPMLEIHGFGIIGQERRTRDGSGGQKEGHACQQAKSFGAHTPLL